MSKTVLIQFLVLFILYPPYPPTNPRHFGLSKCSFIILIYISFDFSNKDYFHTLAKSFQNHCPFLPVNPILKKNTIQMFCFDFGKGQAVWITLKGFWREQDDSFFGICLTGYCDQSQCFLTLANFRVTCVSRATLSSSFSFGLRKINGENLT